MTSRLDRLFILLESGSSAVTRTAAAKQIGQVQKLYPHELHALLNRLIGYLHSSSWDTRIAAAQTVEAILRNVPAWQPDLCAPLPTTVIKREISFKKEEDEEEEKQQQQQHQQPIDVVQHSDVGGEPEQLLLLSFADFQLEQILHKGARLIGSEGMEFDVHEEPAQASDAATAADTAAERLSRQRALLNEKLGLTQASKLGVNLLDMITDEDMNVVANTNAISVTRQQGAAADQQVNANDVALQPPHEIEEAKVPVEHILNIKPNANLLPTNGQQLSCREMNRAKRKARQQNQSVGGTASSAVAAVGTAANNSNNNNNSNNGSGGGGTGIASNNKANGNGAGSVHSDEPEKKKIKSEISRQELFYSLSAPVPDVTGAWIEAVNWPLENFCARLYVDLFNPKWEVRHGAATALRELINSRAAAGAGKSRRHMTRAEMEEQHSLWLEDAALRLLCVLCLDRFGDFVADQVVAPVRETCAQVLGTVVKEMQPSKVAQIVSILLKLLKQREWEVRHGGLLGLKYVFVVREDLLPVYLPQTISDILLGLFDPVDDVGAVAASTLIPVAAWLPKLLNATQVSSIVKMLWDLLLDQDELTSACNSFMGLLAAILCLPNASSWIQMEPMAMLVPRLWPFLSHSTSSVRKSTLLTLQTLTGSYFQRTPSKEAEENHHTTTTPTTPTSTEPTTATALAMPSVGATAATPPSAALDAHMNFDSKPLALNFGVIDWQWRLLQDAMRHIYQRVLVEPQVDIQQLAMRVWYNLIESADLGALLHAACPYVSSWICLAMQPPRLAFDPATLIHAPPNTAPAGGEAATSMRRRTARIGDDDLSGGSGGASGANAASMSTATQRLYLGGSEATPLDVRERNYVRARVMAARVLGALSRYLVQAAPGVTYTLTMESPTDCYTKVLLGHLNSRSAVQRLVCGLTIASWAQTDASVRGGALPRLQERLRDCVQECVYYDEVAVTFTRLHQETHDLIATLKQYKIPIEDFQGARVLSLAQIEAVATTLTADLHLFALKPKLLDTLQERRRALLAAHQHTTAEQSACNVSAQAALAGAIVCLHALPDKLNPVVRPLMEALKRERCALLQQRAAEFLALLMEQVCVRQPSPNQKILGNLCTLLRSDAHFTPPILASERTLRGTSAPQSAGTSCVYYGILSWSLQQQQQQQIVGGTASTATSSSSATAGTPRGPGRPPADTAAAAATVENASTVALNEVEQQQCRTQRCGAAAAIAMLCSSFGADLFARLPSFEQIMFEKIAGFLDGASMEALADVPIDLAQTNELMTALQLIEVAVPHLNPALHARVFAVLPQLGVLIQHPYKAVRHMVARCIATLASIDAGRTMDFVVNELVALLRQIEHVIQRQGALEAIDRCVERLQIQIVPYIVLLVVPLLGAMSDPDESVRLLATHCFATLVQLMPLDSKLNAGGSGDGGEGGGAPKNAADATEAAAAGIDADTATSLRARRTRDRQFLDYLFAPRTIPDYRVPVPVSVELRGYQQAGVNWLWFLNKYNLHGILCDDMGLGKTLQAICILAGDHCERDGDRTTKALPSLVICPPTLTGHWVYEVAKFLPRTQVLRPLHYVGLPLGREKLRTRIGAACNLVVASYDTVRKDIDYLAALHWNYCVLDEGHVIKNGKTKSSKAIKQLKANHRLILSGTPIQNNVLELWSLFDFLMPGFLGTERQFAARYSRPILASRDSKSSARDQEAGVLAMESLHRQVLPFLLRRVKEDVLTDLPPKITQDLLCELSPLQERLYEDFSRAHLSSDIKSCLDSLAGSADGGGASSATPENLNTKTHIFHALRYLQNVCNHPKLVLTPKHPEFMRITQELTAQQSSLSDIEHSAKLPALKQLLLDCGIGAQTEAVSAHRALIFCQLKAMLDIVERDLLRKHLPSVTYLRLDGSVPASQRQDIVNNFNTDPSIDVLLLTTQVGGLGLNLTGADTVIFVEHDWNPMKDLQAMDRAHRIGQRRVVNVYRLITRKSLEEKIMGLQKFKLLTANTVVSAENAALDTMATEQLFDLFQLQCDQNKAGTNGGSGGDNNKTANTSATSSTAAGQQQQQHHVSVHAVIENLPELWSEQQYDEEYDLSNFVQNLKKC